MRERRKRSLQSGILLLVLFAVWTVLIKAVDVQCAGETGQEIGFATLNIRIHEMIGVHMQLYTVTDWLGLVPIFICLLFGAMGLMQLIKRKSLRKVDVDILWLGVYYLLVILLYLLFEMFPINFRPVFIDGRLEASYPSSTTLLVLSVVPTLVFQVNRRMSSRKAKNAISILTPAFSLFMVLGRLLSGVHWFTDIAGAILLSRGLFGIYKAVVLSYCKEEL